MSTLPSTVSPTRRMPVLDDWDWWANGLPTTADWRGDPRPVFPDPHEDNGLPPGWRIVSRYANFHPDIDMVLARRTQDGRWVRMVHQRWSNFSILRESYRSLPGAHNAARDATDTNTRLGGDMNTGNIAAWLSVVLGRFYDPADPVEAAELFVLALGGRVSRSPAVLG